jgi:hypothetical protein
MPGSPSKLERPWLAGLVDSLLGARLLTESDIPHRNRLSILLLDSAFETTCKAFLRYVAKIPLDESHKHRENLVKATKAKLAGIDDIVWETIEFNYQEIRNDLYHQATSKTITDDSLMSYKEAIEFIIDNSFGVNSAQLVEAAAHKYLKRPTSDGNSELQPSPVLLAKIGDKVDKILCVVAETTPRSYSDVNDYLKRQGERLRLTSEEFNAITARNRGSKRLFYYNTDEKKWELSALGKFKYMQLREDIVNE